MKEEGNIDKFIINRLKESSGEEDWNVPSDDIWNAAKPHFPQRKKRRFIFVMLFFGLLTIGLLGIFVHKNFGKTKLTKTETDEVDQTDSNIVKNELKSLQSKVDLGEQRFDAIDVELNEALVLEDLKQDQVGRIPVAPGIVETISLGKDGIESKVSLAKTQTIIVNKSKNSTQKIENSNIESNDQPIVKIATQNVRNVELVEPLIGKQMMIGDEEKDFGIVPNLNVNKNYTNKWELGLSHSRLLVLIKGLVELEEDVEANETVDLGIRQYNLNLEVTKRLNRRFSISSGFNYYDVGLNIDFELEDEYVTGTNTSDISYRLNSPNVPGSLSFSDETREIELQFIPGTNLVNGDKIEIAGKIPLDLKFVQFPILLNYHLERRKRSLQRKFDWRIQAGFSLDHYQLAIDEIELNVKKDGELISDSVDFDSVELKEFGFSIYTGVGVRYHINDHWNIGLNTRFDLTDLFLSTYGVGVYYGF